jgi:hypothetical protein
MTSKPQYATRAEWRRLHFRPVPGAPFVVENGRRVYAAWFVTPAPRRQGGTP